MTISLLVFSAILAYLFRVQTEDNPSIGIIKISYRWGYPYRVTCDCNRDGRVDFISTVAAPFGPLATHTYSLIEYREDRDFDGYFEIRAHLLPQEESFFELDGDGDGEYEEKVEKPEFPAVYEDLGLVDPQADPP